MRNQLSFEEPGDNESVCSLEKSRAETVFEQYLADRDTSWEYEALPGRKKPDYLIPHAGGSALSKSRRSRTQIRGPRQVSIRIGRFVRRFVVRASNSANISTFLAASRCIANPCSGHTIRA